MDIVGRNHLEEVVRDRTSKLFRDRLRCDTDGCTLHAFIKPIAARIHLHKVGTLDCMADNILPTLDRLGQSPSQHSGYPVEVGRYPYAVAEGTICASTSTGPPSTGSSQSVATRSAMTSLVAIITPQRHHQNCYYQHTRDGSYVPASPASTLISHFPPSEPGEKIESVKNGVAISDEDPRSTSSSSALECTVLANDGSYPYMHKKGRPPYSCPYSHCDSTFERPSTLKQVRSFSSPRVLQILIMSSFRQHIQMHTGEKRMSDLNYFPCYCI
jgi:hypothetical protein